MPRPTRLAQGSSSSQNATPSQSAAPPTPRKPPVYGPPSAPSSDPFTSALRLSPTSRFVVSSQGQWSPWWLRVEERDSKGDWSVVPTPGLHLEDVALEGVRNLFERRLAIAGTCPPDVSLLALAELHAFRAREGDPQALVIMTVLRALDLALQDDPTAANEFLNRAYTYLRQRRPGTVPFGAGDPRIKRPGRRPDATLSLLRVARDVHRELPPFQMERLSKQRFARYLDLAERLGSEAQHLYPGVYPSAGREEEAATEKLARALSRMNPRSPEFVAKAALRAFGLTPKQAANAFTFLDKMTKRNSERV